jgi:hypothetical protein
MPVLHPLMVFDKELSLNSNALYKFYALKICLPSTLNSEMGLDSKLTVNIINGIINM